MDGKSSTNAGVLLLTHDLTKLSFILILFAGAKLYACLSTQNEYCVNMFISNMRHKQILQIVKYQYGHFH